MKKNPYLIFVLFGLLFGTSCKNKDILISDFEAENFGDWKVEGEAIGTSPVKIIQAESNGRRIQIAWCWGKARPPYDLFNQCMLFPTGIQLRYFVTMVKYICRLPVILQNLTEWSSSAEMKK